MWKKDNILVVDDSRFYRQSVVDILSDEYDIIEAENGAEALKILEEDKARNMIVAVILDLVMPVMDGFEFLQHFHEDEKIKHIPIVVATSEKDEENERNCLKLGVWDFVHKPYDAEILRMRIVNAVKRACVHSMEHDPLTGVYNRQKLYQSMRYLLTNKDKEFAYIQIDIERFKMINTFYGTAEGDRLLCYLAQVIREMLWDCEDCTYGRIAADIFGILIRRDDKKINEIEETIRKKLKNYKANYLLNTATGIYIVEDNQMEISAICDKAAIAAKGCKNNYMVHKAVYTPEMSEILIKEQRIINEMDKALKEEEFVVYFQPKYSLESLKPSGAEALVRWRKPDGRMVSPGEFIPIFERNGFIIKLDYYVWEKVCQFIRRELDEGHEVDPISVNVSRVNLYNPKFFETLVGLVENYKIPPRYLNLELTESAFSDDAEMLRKTVDYLHKSGFTIMMDDFGSGYSSLNFLKDINLDVLKIDMKFLAKGPSTEKCEKIIGAVINMAISLDMPVIAEGVEEKAQVELLKRLGCDYIQGFYFAKPMKEQEYLELVYDEKI